MRDNEEESVSHEPVRGYPSLAKFAAIDRSGHCTHIYRGFHELAARNLFHLQSQLAELENRQRAFDEEDWASSNLDVKGRCRDWAQLEAGANDASSDQRLAAQQRIDLSIHHLICLGNLALNERQTLGDLCGLRRLCSSHRCFREQPDRSRWALEI